MNSKIHKTAIIDKSAKIADNVEIGPFVVIGKNVTIAKNNVIGPYCVIENADIDEGNAFIGNVFAGVRPQDLSYDVKMNSKIKIGKNNTFRECCTIHRSTKEDVPTIVGDGGLYMANTHIAHDCKTGNNVIIANSSAIAGHVEIGDRAIISGLVAVHQFCRIGKMSMLSGGAMVNLDIPPYCRAQGDRAKLVGLNIVGLIRNGLSKETISEIKKVYKTLFMSKTTLTQAIEKLEKEDLGSEGREMVDFCKASKRGIAAARRKKSVDSVDEN